MAWIDEVKRLTKCAAVSVAPSAEPSASRRTRSVILVALRLRRGRIVVQELVIVVLVLGPRHGLQRLDKRLRPRMHLT